MGRRVGHHAGQVRGAARRRRADRTCPNSWARPTPWCAPNTDGAPTTPTSTASLGRWERCRVAASCSVPAAPPPLRSPAWRRSASTTSPWSPATRTRPPVCWNWPTRSGWARGTARSTTTPCPDVSRGRPWWSVRCPPTSPRGTPTRLRRRPCCWTRSTTRGPRRWPSAVTGAGGRVVGGLQMLLFQALPQVEQFTGRPAPREQMAAALG